MGIYIIVGIIYRYWSGFSDLYGCSSCNSSSNAKNQLQCEEPASMRRASFDYADVPLRYDFITEL